MDTSLSLSSPVPALPASAPILERSVTSKVTKIEATDQAATLPASKPFVAQVVNARLSGTDFPQNPSEIAPPERTLRPYDVPMLPYETDTEARLTDGTAATDTALPSQENPGSGDT